MLIVYAEDDSEDVEVLQEALAEIDPKFVCQSVPDGSQLFSYLENTIVLPDLLFLDINMPGINGIECLRRLKKASSRYNSIPTVIFTTSKRDLDKAHVKKLGALEFITKPNSFNDLVVALKSLISKVR